MAENRLPRGRHADRTPTPIADMLPEKVRIQAFAYNRRTRQYHALSPCNVKVIVRNERELARLFRLIEDVVANAAAWQD